MSELNLLDPDLTVNAFLESLNWNNLPFNHLRPQELVGQSLNGIPFAMLDWPVEHFFSSFSWVKSSPISVPEEKPGMEALITLEDFFQGF
ncbi:MAG: hypothetical protein HC921_20735 [Synechococcaceae cyanobacterium SM2_3_1]|nr:hypothetical protein [Synechococcaceae cyanobacterium SM2_3_1]